ncbi:prolyl hydroxylase family protein [Qipengyuania qiaonensis]|uniref:2OG-Fe(II) oxygenase n=1 Tax=Qipengyuania qiaonensis TaxID=2867240 RepID=A0ABS7JD12_9SPHN|nr:2OG-Fe(II) oxygenase [Qipengyuania qiaonensis]MBX7483934.1 2OG-Fe(II) oxygenase [Qipengyuania qiaonensis]
MSVLSRFSRLLGRSEIDPRADPAVMRGIGDAVRDRLRTDPQVQSRGGDKADLFLMRGLLTAQECRKLIAIIDSRIQPSVLFSEKVAPKGRTSSTHFFSEDMPETLALSRKIGDVTGIARVHAEPLQGQRYRVGEEYRHHRDHFRLDRPHWQVERRRGGQRSWTAMVYLNAVEEGGETEFPELDLRVVPEPGLLLMWDNMDRKGHPNRATRHAALPVQAGEKYVVTQWYRQGEWSLRQRD